jgi:starch synthase
MIAMRYGTPPIAHRTGGLADTIVDLGIDPAAGTGFLFDRATPEALIAAVDRAVAVFEGADRGPWHGLVARGMAVDWAWESSSAPLYAAMFRRAIGLRRSVAG